MSSIIYIKASPRAGRSYSIALADQFIDAYMKVDRNAQVAVHDVFKMDIPPMDGLTLNAKYSLLHGRQATNEEQLSWMKVEHLIEDFKAANKYVFAVPMWNFSIPYELKHYLDVIIQPGYTFSYSPNEGYKGMVNGKRAFIAYASGGEYSLGTSGEDLDYCRNYMQLVLSFMGISDVRHVAVEPTLQRGSDEARRREEDAIMRAREMAAKF